MKALILAAGYGTRLYPYTRNHPKPLLRVHKRLLIDYLLDKLAKLDGLSRIVVVTNARFFEKFKAWKDASPLNDKIRIVNDGSTSPRNKLGAIVDMRLGIEKGGEDEDYLVLGGDNFLDESLGEFVAFAINKRPAISIGVVDVGSKKKACHYGVVVLAGDKQVMDFQEKPKEPKSSLAATCLYYFPKVKLGLVKKCLASSLFCFDSIGNYIGWLSREDLVYGFIFKKMWFDVGRPEVYRNLNKILKQRG